MRRYASSSVMAALVVGLGMWVTLDAYTTNGHKWATSQVLYYVNPANLYVPQADAVAAIQRGAAAWTQSGANVQLVYAGTTTGSSLTLNRKNEVFFRNDVSSAIAEAYWWWDGTGNLVDADIVFHQNFKFFTHAAGGCSGGHYIENAATHEFGHALGLGHSAVSAATMWPTAYTCETTRETLDVDDMNGIEALYPPTSAVQLPVAPQNAQAGAAGSSPTSAIDVRWTDMSGNEDGFVVYRSTGGSSFAQIATLAANTTSFLNSGLSSGQSYSYQVRSFNTAGMSGASNTATAQTQTTTTAPPPSSSAISLLAKAYKLKGIRHASLTWSGTTALVVDVYRNNSKIVTTANTGAYVDVFGKGGGTFTYRVCAAGSSTTCSNQVSIAF